MVEHDVRQPSDLRRRRQGWDGELAQLLTPRAPRSAATVPDPTCVGRWRSVIDGDGIAAGQRGETGLFVTSLAGIGAVARSLWPNSAPNLSERGTPALHSRTRFLSFLSLPPASRLVGQVGEGRGGGPGRARPVRVRCRCGVGVAPRHDRGHREPRHGAPAQPRPNPPAPRFGRGAGARLAVTHPGAAGPRPRGAPRPARPRRRARRPRRAAVRTPPNPGRAGPPGPAPGPDRAGSCPGCAP